MYTPLDGCTGERGRSTDVLSTATPREIRAWHLSPCRANIGSTGERGPAADFSRPPRREKSALGTLSRPPRPEKSALGTLSRPPRPEKSALGTLSRPPRREKSALGTFPPVEPILGQPRISLDRAVERECQARIFSRPPPREKSALGTLSRGGGRERVPGADLLSTATSREIRAWHSLSTATPREIRAHPLFPL